MTTAFFGTPDDNQQSTGSRQQEGETQNDVQVSLPNNDRPEGPFEHSGETAGWTKAEETEQKDQEP